MEYKSKFLRIEYFLSCSTHSKQYDTLAYNKKYEMEILNCV
jgi:hypothetical protein